MSEPVFNFDGEDPRMGQAYDCARRSFKFFWRELSWERRRIVPGLGLAIVKFPFTDGPRDDENPEYEHMWVDELEFDGVRLKGCLLNAPNWLTSVKKGGAIDRPLADLTDWMLTAEDRAYGGFTVNLMRANMNERERRDHDRAWGLEFGDPNEVSIEIDRGVKEKSGLFSRLFSRTKAPDAPEIHRDHPMCTNMLPKYEEHLRGDPALGSSVDEQGWTLLQREALAGNFGVVRLFVQYGADVRAITPDGQTAAGLARLVGWPEIASFLDRAAQS
jgi:uncharacterized protein YegJ (DUF2314 family)